jgi:hypothetical protein
MESPSSLSALRHRLRATVCCCFGQGGLGERVRWRRRAGVGEFRYDPLSYALNFDEGDGDKEEEQEATACSTTASHRGCRRRPRSSRSRSRVEVAPWDRSSSLAG